MRSSLRYFVSLVVVLVLAACSEHTGHSLTVHVITGLVPGPEFNRLETDVFRASADEQRAIDHADTDAFFGLPYARGQDVAKFAGLASGELVVRVRAYTPQGVRLAEQNVRMTLSSDSQITLYLDRACANVQCPAPAGSATLTACFGGQCADPRCNPDDVSTRQYCPPIDFCNAASECPAVAACAAQQCISGLCVPEQIAATEANACADGLWCNPDAAENACQMTPTSTLTQDGGIDAGIRCGTICFQSNDACSIGYWECADGGAPTCSSFIFATAGTSCGETGNVCDGRGTCVEASDGGITPMDSGAQDAGDAGDAGAAGDAGDASVMTDGRVGDVLDGVVAAPAGVYLRFANFAEGYPSVSLANVELSEVLSPGFAFAEGMNDYIRDKDGTFTYALRDGDGTTIATRTLTLEAGNHYTMFAYVNFNNANALEIAVIRDFVDVPGTSVYGRVVNLASTPSPIDIGLRFGNRIPDRAYGDIAFGGDTGALDIPAGQYMTTIDFDGDSVDDMSFGGDGVVPGGVQIDLFIMNGPVGTYRAFMYAPVVFGGGGVSLANANTTQMRGLMSTMEWETEHGFYRLDDTASLMGDFLASVTNFGDVSDAVAAPYGDMVIGHGVPPDPMGGFNPTTSATFRVGYDYFVAFYRNGSGFALAPLLNDRFFIAPTNARLTFANLFYTYASGDQSPNVEVSLTATSDILCDSIAKPSQCAVDRALAIGTHTVRVSPVSGCGASDFDIDVTSDMLGLNTTYVVTNLNGTCSMKLMQITQSGSSTILNPNP